MRKSGNLSMREILVLTSAYAHPYVRTDSGGGGGGGKFQGKGRRMPSLLGGKSRGAFGQPAFFSLGNRMAIVAFEKELKKKKKKKNA